MTEQFEDDYKPMRIGLLGASFDTGNMGVSALAESSVKIILNRWPDAEITFLGNGYVPRENHLFVLGKEISIKSLPIRFSKNILLPYHFLWFAFYSFLMKVLPTSRLRQNLARRNPCFKTFYETDFVVDITGGDSFSDIYGFKRFFLGFLCKWLVTFLGKNLVLLPQTYGPFQRPLTKAMARYILNRATMVYSRDQAGVEYVNSLLNNKNCKIKFAPDVAFVLDPRKPENLEIEPSANIRTHNSIVVGLNVNGLLFNGGYTRDNMFALKVNYCALLAKVIDFFMKNEKVIVILVPHIFTGQRTVESDPDACLKVYEQLRQIYPGRLFLVKGVYDQCEIKYVIGLCDFFVGSRMHSCIAALSQCIPTVGIAYSKKFYGVFGSVGQNDCVADMRKRGEKALLENVKFVFEHGDKIREHLKQTIPQVKESILKIFIP